MENEKRSLSNRPAGSAESRQKANLARGQLGLF
jgi:hypothetical protein